MNNDLDPAAVALAYRYARLIQARHATPNWPVVNPYRAEIAAVLRQLRECVGWDGQSEGAAQQRYVYALHAGYRLRDGRIVCSAEPLCPGCTAPLD